MRNNVPPIGKRGASKNNTIKGKQAKGKKLVNGGVYLGVFV
jgi:hypothetical protein